jgi:hypothetical protein
MSLSFLFGILSIGFLDSLNPSSIAMTFVILGSEKQKILEATLYTLGIYTASFLIGVGFLLVFHFFGHNLQDLINFRSTFDLEEFIKKSVTESNHQHLLTFFGIELIAGPLIMYYAFKVRKKSVVTKIRKFTDSNLWSAFKLGILLNLIELTTSLPYFGVLTSMYINKINWPVSMVILLLYNVVYVLPTIGLVLIYIYFNDKFDSIILVVNKGIEVTIQFLRFVLLLLLGASSTLVGVMGLVDIYLPIHI